MDINVKIAGMSSADNGRTVVYLSIDGGALTSMILEENDVQTEGALKAALSKRLKAQELVSKEFVIKT